MRIITKSIYLRAASSAFVGKSALQTTCDFVPRIKMGAGTKVLCFGIVAALAAYLYPKWQNQTRTDLDAIEKLVTEAWAKDIRFPEKPFSRLAVG